MARVKGEGSIYQRASDGRWIGAVTVNGKRRTVSATTLTKLRPKMRQLQAEVASGVLTDSTTVEEWMNHWLQTIAKRKVRPSTLAGYEGYARTWIVPILGRHRLDRLRQEHVRGLFAAMENAEKSPATIRQAYAILRRALEVAEDEGRMMRNVAAQVDAPEVGKSPRQPLSRAEVHRVLDYLARLDDPATTARIWCAFSGLRQGEALGLRWSDVNLEESALYVSQALQRQTGKGLVIVKPKSDASTRRVPLLPEPADALARHLATSGGVGLVFGGLKPTAPEVDHRRWKAVLAASLVHPYSLHAARNTTASMLDEAGVSPTVVAEILGHSTAVITLKHYTRANASRHDDAMRQLGTLLRSDVSGRALPPSS